MVTENQPGPTEDASWPPEGVAWDEDTEGRGDPGKYLIHVTDFFFQVLFPLWICQNRLCSATGTTDPQISEATHTCIHTFITNLHMYHGQWGTISSHVHHLEHTTSGAEKRETRESHGIFMSPLGRDTCDTTHISLARMSHWELEKQLFDEYYCLSTSFSRTLESSAVSFFSPWRSFWGTALCRDWTWSDPLRVGFEGNFYLAPLVCLWLLTPLQLVRMGLIRLCLPCPSPFPTQYH